MLDVRGSPIVAGNWDSRALSGGERPMRATVQGRRLTFILSNRTDLTSEL
jgi:hypothetical protein